MQAIILAAGMGKRLKELTQNNTKCMVKVNGVSLIDRMLHQIERYRLKRIVIVIGYERQKLKDYIATLSIETPIIYVENPVYDTTNNIYSLALAKDYLCEDDTLLFESDLIFEDSILEDLIADPRETLALVDKYESWMDGTCVKINDEDGIDAFVPGKKFKFDEIGSYYKTVNIYKFSKHFSVTHYVPFLDAYSRALGNNEYYEQVLRVITMLDDPEIKAKRLEPGRRWYEIDDVQDLDIASSIFLDDGDEKLQVIQNKFGGYWRYPKMLDYCNLGNPFFPPERMIDEIKVNIGRIVTTYPSGMETIAMLVGKNLGVSPDNIVVSNGIEELIKSVMSLAGDPVGIIRPTNEE
ncbi:MAG: NTP transferase domain-containing protein, partial [Lachnospiraceae bacterium]|nr:NTP transferase domain-containing protein [Lachnospiraceae bacterium]